MVLSYISFTHSHIPVRVARDMYFLISARGIDRIVKEYQRCEVYFSIYLHKLTSIK